MFSEFHMNYLTTCSQSFPLIQLRKEIKSLFKIIQPVGFKPSVLTQEPSLLLTTLSCAQIAVVKEELQSAGSGLKPSNSREALAQ